MIQPPRPWGFWATLGLGLAILFIWGTAQTIVGHVFMAANDTRIELTPYEPPETGPDWKSIQDYIQKAQNASMNALAPYLAQVTILPCPVGLLLAWLFVRIRRMPVLPYLGINRPRLGPLFLSLLAIAAVVLMMGFLYEHYGLDTNEDSMVNAIRHAPSKLLILIAVVIAAPLFEETLFRGFLYRGFSSSIGPIAAVVVTSAIFGVIHMQYSLFGMLQVFLLGLALGITRWVTGSTTIAMCQHGLVNLMATLGAFYYTE